MLATLAQARLESKVKSTSTQDDLYLLQALRFVSARIETIQGQEYEPRRQAKTFDACGDHVTSSVLYLDGDPLLEVVSITDGEGQTLAPYVRATDSGDYLLPGGSTPYDMIGLADSSSKSWLAYNGDPRGAITITGLWGYHSRYSDAWVSANDTVQNNPLGAGDTTLTVADADGVDVFGMTPRFSPGQLLRIESEFVEVTAVNTTTNAVTIRRGMRGTTAAAHMQGTAISWFQPEPVIQRAAQRWAGYLYDRRGSFEMVRIEDITTLAFPPDMPQEVANILGELPQDLWRAV